MQVYIVTRTRTETDGSYIELKTFILAVFKYEKDAIDYIHELKSGDDYGDLDYEEHVLCE